MESIRNSNENKTKITKTTYGIDDEENTPSTSSFKPNKFETKMPIPLLAKDSEWVGIKFIKPTGMDVTENEIEKEEHEIQTVETDEKELPPLLLLFPNLKNIHDGVILDDLSTTDFTRMLVGQCADFSHMKSAKKLITKDNKLETVPEISETLSHDNEENTDISESSKNHISDCSEPYDVELEEEDLKPRHKKRRKTKSSSETGVPNLTRSSSHLDLKDPDAKKRRSSRQSQQSKLRISPIFSKPVIQVVDDVPSSQDSFGDDEREEEEGK